MRKWILPLLAAYCLNLSAETNVLVFAGSTRKDSYNKLLAKETAKLAQEAGAKVVFIDLKDYPMPLYDADHEVNQGMPENAKKLRAMMIHSDVIFMASPEYNGSMSGVFKNAIDWASREDGKPSRTAFKDKKFVIMSATAGPSGGTSVLSHLRDSISNIGGVVLVKQIQVPNAYEAFTPQGQLSDPKAENELKNTIKEAIQSK